ncbi:hypothetical protein PHLCEN_2v7520 [Hermanssonia centrifuga]|uniref:F-box domain-containing protein n=1 Tax=Hermanssonia centrifuga TaxID=98765 RepID=A0A2R6NWB0_9APHY|nr:hypothetical protein PHLCEN_2v7520 [Hermanssonia centrifuga]
MENIFLRYSEVVERSPMLLTHVCRLWRQVALSSGRLWRNIILSPPERAKHHMKLSQGCLLRVAWFKWTYKIKTPPDFSWIQPYSPRFEELLLVHQPDSIAAVLDSLGPLPQLLNLTIIAPEDNPFHHSLSISFSQAKLISVDMPSLQILVLTQDDPILPSLIITLHFVSLRRDTGRPLKHIKLDNCKYTEGDLAALQTVAYDALEVNCLG